MKTYRGPNEAIKIALLTSHPVQYHVPLFRLLHKSGRTDLMVYFCSSFGVGSADLDSEFGKQIDWGSNVLHGYRYRILQNYLTKPKPSFWGQINPGIVIELYREHFDVLMIYGWNSFTNFIALIAAKCLGVRVFLRGENPLNHERTKPKWKRAIKRLIFPWLFRLVDTFLYIGEENRKFYRFYGVPDMKLFPCLYAVDNARFHKAAEELQPERSAFRAKCGMNPGDVAILFVGKLIEKKCPLDLLRAFKLLTTHRQLFATPHLFLVGSGDLEKKIKTYMETNNLSGVHLVGFQSQSELPRYYAAADIFVLPSGSGETWGLVVNEAMNFSIPVIVSDRVGCHADLVRHGENGFVFPFGDVKKLAEYLECLITNKKIRKNFGKRSSEIIYNYSYEKDMEGILCALS